jgi:prepilin-type N-terminal cleavage/methylation domain-containing protein
MPRRGFTLVELMTVTAIIGVLSGILVAGAGYLQQRALRSRTLATLAQVSTAIEMFHADKGGYPPDFTCTTDSNVLIANQYVWPCEALWFWLEYWGPHQQYPKQPYLHFKRDQVIAGETKIHARYDQSACKYHRIVDAWGNPMNYKSANGNSYRFTDGNYVPRQNRQSYDLCSYGADNTTWKDMEKPFDRQKELRLDQMTTVVHYNGRDHGQIPNYLFKPFDTQVSAGGKMKLCFAGADNDDINNWQRR